MLRKIAHRANVFDYLCADEKSVVFMKKNEEYQANVSRDWMVFIISTLFMIGLYFVATEWIWVAFPFVLTALAGAMKRL